MKAILEITAFGQTERITAEMPVVITQDCNWVVFIGKVGHPSTSYELGENGTVKIVGMEA